MMQELDDLEGAIAIVGMAGRFPGARDVAELWRNLRAGVESVRFLSREELAALGAGPRRGRSRAGCRRWRCRTASTSSTPPFFGISHREAEILDPAAPALPGGVLGRRSRTPATTRNRRRR